MTPEEIAEKFAAAMIGPLGEVGRLLATEIDQIIARLAAVELELAELIKRLADQDAAGAS